jgi:maltose phosphorylase
MKVHFLHASTLSRPPGQNGHGVYLLLANISFRLDDYNKEVEEGCHITHGGTWMSIVEGFGGMRKIMHCTFLPKSLKSGKPIPLKSILEVSFKVDINHDETTFSDGTKD